MLNEIHIANGDLLTHLRPANAPATTKGLNKSEFVALGMHLGKTHEQEDAAFQNDLNINSREYRSLMGRMKEYDELSAKFMAGEHAPTVAPGNERERVRAAGLAAYYDSHLPQQANMDGGHAYRVFTGLQGTSDAEVSAAAVKSGAVLGAR